MPYTFKKTGRNSHYSNSLANQFLGIYAKQCLKWVTRLKTNRVICFLTSVNELYDVIIDVMKYRVFNSFNLLNLGYITLFIYFLMKKM